MKGAITSWNFPLNIAAFKISSALAAGCTVVLKPSPLSSLSCLLLGDICTEAGLPGYITANNSIDNGRYIDT